MAARPEAGHAGRARTRGVSAALLSAFVLGLAPIFGKQAMLAGTPPLSVVALRTVLAALVLWTIFGLFGRRYLYIYPVGLVGCLAAGLINGLGSLMYYSGLGLLNASVAQLLYTLYPIFLTLFARLDGHAIAPLTVGRTLLAVLAVYLLTYSSQTPPAPLGVVLMIGASLFYAAHLALNQRVLYDVPAPTVAVYTLTGMAATAGVSYLLAGMPAMPPTLPGWQAVLLLTLVTVVSRLSLFMGVKHLGGVQAALIGLSELLVTVLAAALLLGESLSPTQRAGGVLLAAAVLLVLRERRLGALPAPKPWAPFVRARRLAGGPGSAADRAEAERLLRAMSGGSGQGQPPASP